METSNTYGHVNGLSIYERPSPDYDPFAIVRERYATLAGNLPPYRRRVVEVPMGLDHPYWINDPHFDLDYHVREIGLAPPGTDDQLAEQVARIIGRPMDRRHPLWEVYVIEGLHDGRWALLSKTHHATIDGASGVIMMQMLNQDAPDAPWPFEDVPWEPEEIPSEADLVRRAVGNLLANPVRATAYQLRVLRSLAESAGIDSISGAANQSRKLLSAAFGRSKEAEAAREQLRSVHLPPVQAPPTRWNLPVGPHRRFAMRSTQLANIKRLKEATGGTVNDVVMAICAGALREYLIRHDELPDEPLQAMVPVSIRTGEEEDPWTNRVSAIVAELPTDALVDATDFTSPAVATAAARLVGRISSRVNLPVNVVISNVPGPRKPLYFAGAKLDNYYPVSTISNNVGLNITVHSYEDKLDIGLVADRDLVPDLWDLVDLHVDEIARLFEATGAEWAEEPAPRPPRRDELMAALHGD
jgi:WS/DGAT/MGAT family acyltransferase